MLGLIVGSYLNVMIDRFGSSRSSSQGRSRCPACQHQLGWGDLVPLLSYLWLGGRCRFCQGPISWRYPVIELMTGLMTVSVVLTFGVMVSTLWLLIVVWTAIVIFWIDIDQLIIPDRAIVVLALASSLWHLSVSSVSVGALWQLFNGSLAGGGILWLIVLGTRAKGMGRADPKLGAALGLLLGWPLILIGLMLGVMIGAIIGLGLLVTRRAGWRDAVPFGPFLLLGAALAMIWGETILNWLRF